MSREDEEDSGAAPPPATSHQPPATGHRPPATSAPPPLPKEGVKAAKSRPVKPGMTSAAGRKEAAFGMRRRIRARRRMAGILIVAVIVLIVLGIALPRHWIGSPKALAALEQIQSEHRIIDVHEHIASLNDVPKLLAAMDEMGIGKCCLMGSSRFTLTLNPDVGFTHYDENNEELMQICRQYPDRFEAWPTVGPTDPEKLEKFKRLVERGAKGLKLYLGHGAVNKKTGQYIFHLIAIDDPQMYPLYQYCEENYIPVVLHVNPSPKAAPGFAEEFVAVLQKFPNMKIVCPHYLLSSEMDNRLRELLDCFPNLYTDVGFGYEDYLKQGMRRISKSPRKFTDIFTRYSGRIMFATDLVVDSSKVKTQQWIVDHLKVYLDMLTQQTYTTPIMPGETLKGLALPPAIIERVLYKNFEEFSARKPKGTKVQPISWTQMKITPLERRPGQTFPPIVK